MYPSANGNQFGLTEKEMAFCEQYAKQNYANATQAYLKVYGCGYDTANGQAHKKLKKPEIKEYLKTLQQEAFDRQMITPERVAIKLAQIAFAEYGDEYYNTTAQLKALDLLQKQLGIQQQKIKQEVENTVIKVTINE